MRAQRTICGNKGMIIILILHILSLLNQEYLPKTCKKSCLLFEYLVFEIFVRKVFRILFWKQFEKNVTVDQLFRQSFYTGTKMILSTKVSVTDQSVFSSFLVSQSRVLIFRHRNLWQKVTQSGVICSIFCFMLLFFESLFLIRQAISFSQSREDSRWKQWNTTRSGRRSWFLSSLFLSFTWLIVSHEVICSHLTLFSCHRHWTKLKLKLNIGFAKECRSNWTRCISFGKKSKECLYRFTCFEGNERGRSGKINWA